MKVRPRSKPERRNTRHKRAQDAAKLRPATPENLSRTRRARNAAKDRKTKAIRQIKMPKLRHNKVIQEKVRLDGDNFRKGDIVYVVIDESLLGGALDESETDAAAVCGICNLKSKKDGLLECNRCLGGFHLSCLDPPLDAIPPGEWVCRDCSFGHAKRRWSATCARERFLQRRGLALARIESMWLESVSKEYKFCGRWYLLPEETHVGRQGHNSAREVFLTNEYGKDLPMESILRHAEVISFKEYHQCEEIGNDVYICNYQYDSTWQRFTRICHEDLGKVMDLDDLDSSSDASDDESIDEFTMADALQVKRGMHLRSGLRTKKQGGDLATYLLERNHIPSTFSRSSDFVATSDSLQALPCREKEHEEIVQFVESVLRKNSNGSGRCLYISGIPGTGKTATVLQVMNSLQKKTEEGLFSPFQFVELNGLCLPSPQHAYCVLLEALTGERLGPKAASAALNDIFSGHNKTARRHTVVLLDELDSLVNRAQTILYNLFDWPSRPNSSLSIIAIANTMDLPERLHLRIGSRLAGNRLLFLPYNREQLETIMKARIKNISKFEDNAITLIARKVANCSGDLRRCLELCRRALEISNAAASDERNVKVSIRDADRAIKEAFNSPSSCMLQESSFLEQILLIALLLEIRQTGKCEVSMSDVADRINILCTDSPPSYASVLASAMSLASRRLVLCSPGMHRTRMKISLNVPTDDLMYVLTNDQALSPLISRLS